MRVAEMHRKGAAHRSPHEGRILTRLAGIVGVTSAPGEQDPVVASQQEEAPSLAGALADGPLGVAAVLALAIHLSQVLAAIHRRGVLHLNINPAHILLHGAQRLPLLIGFHMATTFAQERPGFTHHLDIRGDLTYLSPEQTGRTGRAVDLRADLYALGATLYEATTGRPPFDAQDSLQLLHDHLVRLPVAPSKLRANMPVALSQVIMRLLEKEPERRYQSADGLAHDLAQVQRALAQGDTSPLRLGEHDFPLQLSAPSRLVGRNPEIGVLRQSLDAAVRGRGGVVLVSGAPGVGKTSLINELRPMVTARRGWFVSGKFDQYQQDASTATAQAFGALGRLLLAEPKAELAAHRERILRALGANAGLICSTPELALLLGPQPEVPPVEPAQAEARLATSALSLLRAIASPERPVVIVLDDLQWADSQSVRFIDAVLHDGTLPGLLLVGSYRHSEVNAAHPVGAALARWLRLAQPPLQLYLANLPGEALQEMLHEMMRLAPSQAAALAQAVGEHTGGNPYDTVELLNALRRDGALRPGIEGWEWDATTLRRYVGHSGVLGLLAARLARLPPSGQAILHVMACLGGQVHRSLLATATGLSGHELDERLVAPAEDGLLVIEPSADSALRLRHDRVQQAVYGSLNPAQRRALHLALARRLAATAEFRAAAVQQYLPAVQDIVEPQECRSVARLLHETAIFSRLAANYDAMQRLLEAARSLQAKLSAPTADDLSQRAAMDIDYHLALFSLARFEEADALYRVIEKRGAPVRDWVDAAGAQIYSLSVRSRHQDAVALGLPLLRQLGLEVPDDFAAADIERRLARLGEWVQGLDLGRDSRPYTGDRDSTAAAKLINRLASCAYYFNLRIMAWLLLEGQVLWTRRGPAPELVAVLAAIGAPAIGLNQDYRTAFFVPRHVLGVSETRGWGSGTVEARFLFGSHSAHWCEPLEQGVQRLQQALEGMMRNGDLMGACICHRPMTAALLDSSATMQGWSEMIESGLALALRLRNDFNIANMYLERRILRGLQGIADSPDGVQEDALAAIARQAMQPSVNLSIQFCSAMQAAVLGDLPALVQHTAQAMKYVPTLPSYRGAQARLLRAYSLAQEVAIAQAGERDALLVELDLAREWLAGRAADAPGNFLHLLTWIDAERAWAVRDLRTAAAAFDLALRQVESLTRAWHRAMISERAGLFHLEQGMRKTGEQFIGEARHLYHAWGAQAKVRRMDDRHDFLASTRAQLARAGTADRADRAGGADGADKAPARVDTLDTMGILRASQALSSETSLARLKARVVDVMGALTGATNVQFAHWDEDARDWFVSQGHGSEALRITVDDAGARGLLPLSAFRYAERTRDPLLVDDAAADDRFARDPYFAGLAHCSLLIVPILSRGRPRAMLLLENRLSRGAFTTARLNAISLIAGQLAVSLDNALLYDRLEQRVRDQTRELVAAARRAGMAQIATNVLHNVGNVLNSVNVSTQVLTTKVSQSRSARVSDLAQLLEEHAADLGHFFRADERGRMLPRYVRKLGQALAFERDELLRELMCLGASVDHIKNVVAMQQSYAGTSGVLESCSITELVSDALRIQQDALARHGVMVSRDYTAVEAAPLDKTRVMQILVNLMENARQAMDGVDGQRILGVTVGRNSSGLCVSVRDNGCGIPADDLARIFSHGFTTKPGGHGFGLHSCALAAQEMGGTLTVRSEGAGTGATFTLQLPLGSDRNT